jgi:hypothetical protein
MTTLNIHCTKDDLPHRTEALRRDKGKLSTEEIRGTTQQIRRTNP